MIARNLKFPVRRSWLTSEGGDREFNGKGTLMMTKAVELQRNPGWTMAQLEDEYNRIFNVQKIIWLSKGDDQLFCAGKKLPGQMYSSFSSPIFNPYRVDAYHETLPRFSPADID